MVCPAVFGRGVLPTGFCRPAVSLQTDGELHRNEHGKEGFRAAGAYARDEESQSYPIDRGGPCVWQGKGSMDLSVGGKGDAGDGRAGIAGVYLHAGKIHPAAEKRDR